MPAPTLRFLAALVLAVLAVVVPVTAGGTALAGPAFPGPNVPAESGGTAVTGPAAATGAVPGAAAPDPLATAMVPAPEPVAAGPHAVPTGRAAALVRASDSHDLDTPAPPGAVLDALIPALPTPSQTGPDDVADDHGITPGAKPGHDVPAEPRGPPAV